MTTLKDLRVTIPLPGARPISGYRQAQIADLVSALRAEGAIVIERTNGTWPTWLTEVISEWRLTVDMFMVDFEDAYTEAQPFPPAGGVS